MPRTIQQSVTLPATAEELFDMYLDPTAHAAWTGTPVTIGRTPGSAFRAFDDRLSGTILHVAPPRCIVQLWRSVHFAAEDIDSTVILTFTPAGEHGRIDLVHVNVADCDYDGVNQGWEKFLGSQPPRRRLGRAADGSASVMIRLPRGPVVTSPDSQKGVVG